MHLEFKSTKSIFFENWKNRLFSLQACQFLQSFQLYKLNFILFFFPKY